MPAPPANLNPHAVGLFLDVDGTLLEICDTPSSVVADEALIELLNAGNAALDGALCLVSGRSIDEVDRIMSPEKYPVAGAHGSELRVADGRIPASATVSFPDDAAKILQSVVDRHEGLLLERKHGGMSLHYRKAPALEPECRKLVTSLLSDLGDDFRLIAGKMVFEIAPAAHNKGAAIRRIMDEPPFAGRTPVFIGDDVTDEDGFEVVNELDGMTVRVGDIADSKARFTLRDVAAVRRWLRGAILGENMEKQCRENVCEQP